MVFSHVEDEFKIRAISIAIEGNYDFKDFLTFDFSKIDLIYNPEYDEMRELYKLPVMFKSLPYGESYLE